MAKLKTDQKTKSSSSMFSSDVPKVDVPLDMVVDADIAAQYLTAVSGFRMNGDVVEVTDIEDGHCVAVVTCRSVSQARELMAAINLTTAETSLTASLHGKPRPRLEIQRTWKELYDEAQEQIKLHQRKIEDVQSQIQNIGSNNRKGRGVEINEFFRWQDLRRPLQDKLVQLQSQREEFCHYVDSIQASVVVEKL